MDPPRASRSRRDASAAERERDEQQGQHGCCEEVQLLEPGEREQPELAAASAAETRCGRYDSARESDAHAQEQLCAEGEGGERQGWRGRDS